jgi:hypothetical protein
MPAATPDAGQNTAKSEVAKFKTCLSQEKYALAMAPAAPSADIHPRPAG